MKSQSAPWAFRVFANAVSDSDSDSEEPFVPVDSTDLDLGSRDESAVAFRKDPWSLAKLNSLSRKDINLPNDTSELCSSKERNRKDNGQRKLGPIERALQQQAKTRPAQAKPGVPSKPTLLNRVPVSGTRLSKSTTGSIPVLGSKETTLSSSSKPSTRLVVPSSTHTSTSSLEKSSSVQIGTAEKASVFLKKALQTQAASHLESNTSGVPPHLAQSAVSSTLSSSIHSDPLPASSSSNCTKGPSSHREPRKDCRTSAFTQWDQNRGDTISHSPLYSYPKSPAIETASISESSFTSLPPSFVHRSSTLSEAHILSYASPPQRTVQMRDTAVSHTPLHESSRSSVVPAPSVPRSQRLSPVQSSVYKSPMLPPAHITTYVSPPRLPAFSMEQPHRQRDSYVTKTLSPAGSFSSGPRIASPKPSQRSTVPLTIHSYTHSPELLATVYDVDNYEQATERSDQHIGSGFSDYEGPENTMPASRPSLTGVPKHMLHNTPAVLSKVKAAVPFTPLRPLHADLGRARPRPTPDPGGMKASRRALVSYSPSPPPPPAKRSRTVLPSSHPSIAEPEVWSTLPTKKQRPPQRRRKATMVESGLFRLPGIVRAGEAVKVKKEDGGRKVGIGFRPPPRTTKEPECRPKEEQGVAAWRVKFITRQEEIATPETIRTRPQVSDRSLTSHKSKGMDELHSLFADSDEESEKTVGPPERDNTAATQQSEKDRVGERLPVRKVDRSKIEDANLPTSDTVYDEPFDEAEIDPSSDPVHGMEREASDAKATLSVSRLAQTYPVTRGILSS